MKDLTRSFWIKLKGAMFLLVGILAAVLLWLDNPSWKSALLLGLALWCFCRAYYFAFYVVEHYVDPSFKFSGLGAFLVYLFRRNKQKQRRP